MSDEEICHQYFIGRDRQLAEYQQAAIENT
jgi:hypothetical protein